MRGDNAARQERPRRLGLSPGARVVLIVAAAFLPLLALHGYSITQITGEQQAHLDHDIEELAEAAALIVQGDLNAAGATAEALSEIPAIRARDQAAVAPVLSRIMAQNPGYSGLWAAGPDGVVYATSQPGQAGSGASIAGQPYFQSASQAPAHHIVADGRGIPGLGDAFLPLVAAPVLVDSRFNGTVQIAFRLTGLEALPTHVGLPPNGVVTVIDGAGTILFRSLQPERWLGVDISGTPAYQQALTASGAFVSPGIDGVQRLLAAATVPGTDWLAVFGVPAAAASAPATTTLYRELALFGLTLVLAGVLAWRGKVLADEVEGERRRLAATIDQMPEGVLVTDGEGRVLQANAALGAIVGVSVRRGESCRAEIEAGVTCYVDGRLATWEELPFERARRGEAVRGAQLTVQRPDGERRDLLANAAPLTGPGGRTEEVVAVLADVTALKDLDRAKDEFLSIAAHELRNPLAGLKGYTELLLRLGEEKGFDEETLRMLRSTNQQADRLTGMTARLLDVSRLQLGRLELVRRRTDLVALTREVQESLQLTTERHRIVVDANPAEIAGDWDGDRLRQVLDNLVGNAIKYAPGGQIRITLRLEGTQADALVSDQGPGIASEQAARLFERFRQAGRTARERAGGLGLGLYLARGIVEAHGGRIGVVSEPGRGATFWFTLPLSPGPVSSEPAPELLARASLAGEAQPAQ